MRFDIGNDAVDFNNLINCFPVTVMKELLQLQLLSNLQMLDNKQVLQLKFHLFFNP